MGTETNIILSISRSRNKKKVPLCVTSKCGNGRVRRRTSQYTNRRSENEKVEAVKHHNNNRKKNSQIRNYLPTTTRLNLPTKLLNISHVPLFSLCRPVFVRKIAFQQDYTDFFSLQELFLLRY